MTRRPRLLLVAERAVCNHEPSFREVAAEVRRNAPDVDAAVVVDRRYRARRLAFATRPTLVFSPIPLRRFRPLRGRVCQGRLLKKSEEYRVLDAAGVPVPRWALLTPDRAPDLSEFGPYVVTKPDAGLRGAEVKIRRRGRVRWKPPARPPPNGVGDLVVQEFVYTGRWPVSYRVMSLFGAFVHGWRAEADRARRPLDGPSGFGGVSIVSSAKGCSFTPDVDEDVRALARRAHAAFPDVPLLGVDIVRDARTGALWVLEVNASGYVWHLDSPTGRGIQEFSGIDFRRDFRAIPRAAAVLADRARRLAR